MDLKLSISLMMVLDECLVFDSFKPITTSACFTLPVSNPPYRWFRIPYHAVTDGATKPIHHNHLLWTDTLFDLIEIIHGGDFAAILGDGIHMFTHFGEPASHFWVTNDLSE